MRSSPPSWVSPLWRAVVRPRSLRGAGGRRVGRRSTQRGVALVVVLGAILVMTVVVTEMNWGARVRYLLAAHQRDEVQAYWLARSGVNIYRLILMANAVLKKDPMFSTYAQYASSMFGVNLGDALWQMVPYLSTGLMRMLFVSGGDADDITKEQVQDVIQTGTVSDDVAEQSRVAGGRFSDENFLDFVGDFSAEVVDEDSRIALSGFSAATSTGSSCLESVPALQLEGLMGGQENDQWFYDRNINRREIIANLADWVDSDNSRCGDYSGYEDDLYNRLESPYLSKNARFDTKEEIRLVSGWEGDVYDRFQEHLTVWGSGKVNINTASREVIAALLSAYMTSKTSDDFVNQLVDRIEEQKAIASFSNGQAFVTYVEQDLGVDVNDELKNAVTTSSSVFRVASVGVVGDTSVTVTTVLDYGQSMTGTVLYWHVE